MSRKLNQVKTSLNFLNKPSFLSNKKNKHCDDVPKKRSLQDQINAESALGRTLFGPIPAGHQREFFHHKENVWLWHENWTDEKGQKQELTLRYEVRPDGVFKRVNGKGKYQKIQGAELKNFHRAARAYLAIIKEKLYN